MNISRKITCTKNKEKYKKIFEYLKKKASLNRLKHSEGVAKLAWQLCGRFNVEPDKGIIAGIGHDIARELDENEIYYWAKQDGKPLLEWEIDRPEILHARAGVEILKKIINIEDEEILKAVKNHVVGEPGMQTLSKIIYIADFLEPSRNFLERDFRNKMIELDLDLMLLAVIEKTFKYLRKSGKSIAHISLEMYYKLKENIGNRA